MSPKWCVVLKMIYDWLRSQRLSRGMGFISPNTSWKNFLLRCVYCYGIESFEKNCKGTCLSYDQIGWRPSWPHCFFSLLKWPVWLLYGNQSIHFHCKTTRPVSIWRGHVMMLRSGLFDFMMLKNFNRSFYTAARPLLCIGKQLTGFYVKRTR